MINTVDIAFTLAWIQTSRASDTLLVEAKALEIYPRATGKIASLPEVPFDDFNDDTKVDSSDVAIMMAWIQIGKLRDSALVLGRAKELYSLTSGSVARFPGPADPKPVDYTEIVLGNNETTMKFSLIPAGDFSMGSNSVTNEKPVHTVTISNSFYMAKTEVTQLQYTCVLNGNPSNFKNASSTNQPVECVSWLDAITFSNRLSEIMGLKKCYSSSGSAILCDFNAGGYRLPTEAEWEYACRAGSYGDYYWGSTFDGSCAWYSSNSGNTTHNVGGKTPNSWGLYDMTGNVWEWCWDWYGESYYSVASGTDPRGPDTGTSRVLRGGSWYGYDFESYCRSAYRYYNAPSYTCSYYGFRVCRSSGQ